MKVSIVIPIYNAARELSVCLESIRTQTFTDFEVICVDDGSTDESLSIAQKFSKLHKRFKVISQANGGASVARNNGLTLAQGEYVSFVDADDHVAENFLDVLYSSIVESNCDISIANKIIVNIGGNSSQKKPALKEKIIVGDDLFKSNLFAHNAPHAKLFRRKFLDENGVRFYEGVTYEDYIFWMQCLAISPRVVSKPENIYFYKKNASSISHRSKGLLPYNLRSRIKQTDECIRILEESGNRSLCDAFCKVQFNGVRIANHIAALADKRVPGNRQLAFQILKHGLKPHEDKIVSFTKGWRRLLYYTLLNGSQEDVLKLLLFKKTPKNLKIQEKSGANQPRKYVHVDELPSIAGAKHHLYEVTDLLKEAQP